ncbi:MerR family DNA-binding transcriptional regulator [Paucibacter sp. PLA-PC-4]|uniref:MerR family transcriptional regulator n=1 Tax=Paucibacter sp. PLA-PC-4 TaxID=2993655 RepID=UPI0022498A06|nr:MerR family DNA-binding transcriptional regulator [Paucibacter sp. PLA-PC-4]MCX2861460.1 MerR family DNA-binding transcriptional regulator [Paucibacter sp. PLA-PC-4]
MTTQASSTAVLEQQHSDAQELLAHSASAPSEQIYGITELCAEFGISQRAIRFYEDKGLLAPRRVNGARIYGQRERARLKLILRAKAIGTKLVDIKQFLDLYGHHGEGRARQLQWTLERTDAAIVELEQKRAHIELTLTELRIINEAVRQQLAVQQD